MGHAGIGIIHPSTAPGDCPGGRGFGQEFDSPHLHQNKKRLEDSSRFLFDNALHFVRLISNRSMRILFCNALPFNHQTETKYRYYYQRNK